MLHLPAARLVHPAKAASGLDRGRRSSTQSRYRSVRSVYMERPAGGTGVVIAQAMEMQLLAQRCNRCKRSIAHLHRTGQRAAPSGCAAVAARRASATALTALNAEDQKAYASTAPLVLAPLLHPCTPPRTQQTPRGLRASPKAVPSTLWPVGCPLGAGALFPGSWSAPSPQGTHPSHSTRSHNIAAPPSPTRQASLSSCLAKIILNHYPPSAISNI